MILTQASRIVRACIVNFNFDYLGAKNTPPSAFLWEYVLFRKVLRREPTGLYCAKGDVAGRRDLQTSAQTDG